MKKIKRIILAVVFCLGVSVANPQQAKAQFFTEDISNLLQNIINMITQQMQETDLLTGSSKLSMQLEEHAALMERLANALQTAQAIRQTGRTAMMFISLGNQIADDIEFLTSISSGLNSYPNASVNVLRELNNLVRNYSSGTRYLTQSAERIFDEYRQIAIKKATVEKDADNLQLYNDINRMIQDVIRSYLVFRNGYFSRFLDITSKLFYASNGDADHAFAATYFF